MLLAGGMHGMTRALLEAADTNVWLSTPAAVAGRLVARTASFCNSAASNYDSFDQALSFFGGGATWLVVALRDRLDYFERSQKKQAKR